MTETADEILMKTHLKTQSWVTDDTLDLSPKKKSEETEEHDNGAEAHREVSEKAKTGVTVA